MAPLSTCTVAVAGTFTVSHGVIEETVKSLGGSFSSTVKGATHLITSPSNTTAKAKDAHKAGTVKVITMDWLDACKDQNKLVSEDNYLISKPDVPVPKRSARNADSQVVEEPKPEPKKRGRAAAVKEKTPEIEEEEQEEEKAAPPAKKAKAVRGKKAAAKADEDVDMADADVEETKKPAAKRGKKDVVVDTEPAPTNGRAKRGAKAAPAAAADEDVDMKDDEKEEEKPKRAARGKKAAAKAEEEEEEKPAAKKGRGKAKKAEEDDKAADDDEDSAPAKGKGKGKGKKKGEDAAPAPPPAKVKSITMQKGCAPVDEYVPNRDGYKVYVDSNGVSYDGSLNQTNIGANANKFYYVQLLQTASGQYATWTRWGRVGDRGQMKMVCGPTPSLDYAMNEFNSKFKAKSGLSWEDRHSTPRTGKYTFVEKNYEGSDGEEEEEDKTKKANGKAAEPSPIPESTIKKELQQLMELIFNIGFFNASMSEMNYDANKLPLGKLSKTTIKKGYEVLKKIGEIIQNPSRAGAVTGYANARKALTELSNQYYSIIPHAFGRNVPPVVGDQAMLKKESDLIDSLGEMQVANEIMKGNKEEELAVNPLDSQFASLKLNTAEPLDKSSKEFELLEGYMAKTHGDTHYYKLKVEEIFRIHRQEEEERWNADGWDKHPNSKRMLLWHGSRTTNFGGILSQGLRIAPPEAPVNGYMFGKGIYLADMASKSAGYCCAHSSNNTGLLLLCEAQIGDPQYELTGASYTASEDCSNNGFLATKGMGKNAPLDWMDAGELGDWAKGAVMPNVNLPREKLVGNTEKHGYLQYNEYIVYNISQVKIRYLFRCKFN